MVRGGCQGSGKVAVRAAVAPSVGRWTTKQCSSCRRPRTMPERWGICPSCLGGTSRVSAARAFRLVAIPKTRSQRLWVGVSQQEIAEETDLSVATIGKAERGEPVRQSTALKIAVALDTTVEDLTA